MNEIISRLQEEGEETEGEETEGEEEEIEEEETEGEDEEKEKKVAKEDAKVEILYSRNAGSGPQKDDVV